MVYRQCSSAIRHAEEINGREGQKSSGEKSRLRRLLRHLYRREILLAGSYIG